MPQILNEYFFFFTFFYLFIADELIEQFSIFFSFLFFCLLELFVFNIIITLACCIIEGSSKLIIEPSHEKTNNLHMRKQRRRSASR